MEQTPQELTHEGLRNSLENGKINNVVIQILSIEKNSKPGIIEVVVSDGFAKHKAIFCEEASKKIEGGIVFICIYFYNNVNRTRQKVFVFGD